MAVCENHSGVTEQFRNVERWQEEHMNNVHKPMNETILSLQSRLPLWATFLIAFLSSMATWGLSKALG